MSSIVNHFNVLSACASFLCVFFRAYPMTLIDIFIFCDAFPHFLNDFYASTFYAFSYVILWSENVRAHALV